MMKKIILTLVICSSVGSQWDYMFDKCMDDFLQKGKQWGETVDHCSSVVYKQRLK